MYLFPLLGIDNFWLDYRYRIADLRVVIKPDSGCVTKMYMYVLTYRLYRQQRRSAFNVSRSLSLSAAVMSSCTYMFLPTASSQLSGGMACFDYF